MRGIEKIEVHEHHVTVFGVRVRAMPMDHPLTQALVDELCRLYRLLQEKS